MDISTTVSRRSSLSSEGFPRVNPKYKQIFSYQESLGLRGYNPVQRIETNTQFIQTLQGQINKKINGSYLFTIGKQEKNERFAEVFVDFFREMRGAGPLVNSAGESLANKFVTSPDMCKIYETSTVDEYGIDTSTEISPTIQLINELKQILEDEYGLQNQFLRALNKNGKRITDFAKLGDRDIFLATLPKDHPYRQKWGLQTTPVYIPLSMIAKLFPKCVEALKEVFNSLLITQWLKNDIDGVKLYLNENDYVDRPLPSLEEIELAVRLWETAKDYGEKQRKYDTEIEAKHWNEFQNDMWGTMVSGGLSICTVNPSFVIGKAAHTMMNLLSNQVDPEGKDKRVQVLKMFGGVGLGGVMGGNPWDLGTSLGIDLVELAVRDQKTTKGESALLTLWGSVLKGVLTGDQKKLVCQILGGCVAEAANQLPETDENTSLERRIARALLTNSDVQAHFIKGFVDKRFKDDPKPKTGGILTPEEQEKYPNQILTEIEPEMHDPEGYKKLLLEGEGLQATLKKLQNDLIIPKSTLEQAQKAVDDNQLKIDKYDKKKGNRAYERYLHYKEKGYKKVVNRNVAQGTVDKITNKIAEVSGKIAENQKAQLVASSPKHIPAPNSGVHIIGNEKTGKNHHPYYFESGKKQGLGKYDNAEDARYISGLFTKVETNKLSLEMQCFDAQRQLVEAGFSIDEVPERPNLSMPTILGNDVDANSKTLNIAGVNHKKTVQSYLKGVETLLGKPINTQGLSKSEVSQITKQVTPNIKDPKQHGFWYNAYRAPGKGLRWLDEHGVSLSVNVNISTDLYKTKPKERTPSHVGNYGYDAPKQDALSNLGNWENIQSLQREQMFERNMAYRSPVDTSSQDNLDYQQFWGQGLNPNVQMPPSDWNNLGRNEIVPYQNVQRNTRIQMAAFVPFEPMIEPSEAMHSIFVNDFTKSLPKGALKVMAAVCTLMLPDMSDIKGAEDPREHFKRSFNYGLKKYDKFVDIQDPNSFGAKAGEFVGEMVALGGIGKVIRVAEGISMIGMACEGGFCGAIMSEAHDTNKVAGIAFGFVGGGVGAKLLFRGGGVSKPLLDRALVRPQGYSKEYNFIRAINDPGYRSGFVSDQNLEKLRNSISQISPRQLKSLENRVSNWLGDGTRLIKNKAGDPIFLSQDNLRRVRFDFNRTDPHNNLHCHVESYINGEWFRSGPIYPTDVPHN